MNDKEVSRLWDAQIAVSEHGWIWENRYGKKILLPPEDDVRRGWTGIWDEDGIPHFLPRYTQGEE